MTRNGSDIDQIIEIRRYIHQNAEGGFAEKLTQKKIRNALLSFGIDNENI